MDTYNYRLDSSAQRQPLPQSSDSQAGQAAKKFEAAKNNAFREDFVPNGGPQHRGPIEGGATGPTPEPRPDKMTGADGVSGFLKGEWDFGSKGLEVKKVEVGVTPHFDWTPSKKGIGPAMKDGKPGVAEGDAYGGSVTTPADVKGDAKKGGAAASGKSGVPEGLDWSRGTRIKGDDIKEMKRDIPPAAPKQINDLGPSTNEPEQKQADTAVARNNDAKLGDDLAQRV